MVVVIVGLQKEIYVHLANTPCLVFLYFTDKHILLPRGGVVDVEEDLAEGDRINYDSGAKSAIHLLGVAVDYAVSTTHVGATWTSIFPTIGRHLASTTAT
jgi:hypothetical protein